MKFSYFLILGCGLIFIEVLKENRNVKMGLNMKKNVSFVLLRNKIMLNGM